MIFISIPKSASSSLLETFSVLHGLPSSQIDLKHLPIPKNFSSLGRIHQDVVNLDKATYSKLIQPDYLYKQHIPPTTNNIGLLKNQKKVILIRRNLKDIVLAYRRAVQKKIHRHFKDFLGCKSESDWFRRAQEVGLLNELNTFREGWLEEGRKSENTHIVFYSELINNPKEVLNSIEMFLGFPVSDKVALSKRRYSRARGIQGYKAILGRKLVKMAINIGAYKFLKSVQNFLRRAKIVYKW